MVRSGDLELGPWIWEIPGSGQDSQVLPGSGDLLSESGIMVRSGDLGEARPGSWEIPDLADPRVLCGLRGCCAGPAGPGADPARIVARNRQNRKRGCAGRLLGPVGTPSRNAPCAPGFPKLLLYREVKTNFRKF